MERVGGRADPILRRRRYFCRLIKHSPVRIEQPTVVGAAYPTIFYATEDKIGASVNAFAVQRPDAGRVVAKEDNVLAHDTDAERRTAGRQIRGESNRLPILPQ
jgi:hypothetical protein